MGPTTFSTAIVSRLTGATPRMLDYWARTKLLPPSAEEGRGKGARRAYTFQDVVAIMTVCKLRERKCPLQQIRTAVKYLRKNYPGSTSAEALSRLTLITDGKDVYLLTDEHRVMNVVTRQWVWSVPLGLLISEVSRKVEALPQQWRETIRVKGKDYRLIVGQDAAGGDFMIECRELPGFLHRAKSPKEVTKKARAAIAALHEYRSQRHHRSRRSGVAVA